MKPLICLSLLVALPLAVGALEFHVSPKGDDRNPGSAGKPFKTIQRAADQAQPGDVITVHAGTYRERITPPRGGESDAKRIVYQAAKQEQVAIKGSEIVKGWTQVQEGVWSVTIPNSFFGKFNPYSDLIRGDWFNGKGREHHTGAVYLNGEWLDEAASLDEVLGKAGAPPKAAQPEGPVLLNVAWLRAAGTGKEPRVAATNYAAQLGTKNAPCDEGGHCVGWIREGNWLRYDGMDLSGESVELRAASASAGGRIELRLGGPDGELLGSGEVPNTGGWQKWISLTIKTKPLKGKQNLCLVFGSNLVKAPKAALWFGKVDAQNTTLWAQFKGVNPNDQLVEVNTRQTVFYPDQPGRNFITVRGFTLQHAATPWAPPTAEQIGLIGTHWSKGWVIEQNTISHSKCSGVALGKHGDQFDNTSANSAEGYVKTIERAHAFSIPWTKENIGHHVVRNNVISHCEQTGIVGSLGAAFSTVSGNVIHDIHVRRLFTGAEMGGIKFHAAIDTVISHNHIYRTTRGLWLDWMAQGTRVSGNLFHDNLSEDIFVEVDHGPFLMDNNFFLSGTSLLDMSNGGAYAHNLFAGKIISTEEPGRETPFHPAHSTVVAGLSTIKGGDSRFYNNLIVGAGNLPVEGPKDKDRHRRVSAYGLAGYDVREFPLQTGGNVYYYGAKPYAKETGHALNPEANPKPEITELNQNFYLRLNLDKTWRQAKAALVTTELLGLAKIPKVGYENPDGSPLKVDADYYGKKRNARAPTPGPFEAPAAGQLTLKVW